MRSGLWVRRSGSRTGRGMLKRLPAHSLCSHAQPERLSLHAGRQPAGAGFGVNGGGSGGGMFTVAGCGGACGGDRANASRRVRAAEKYIAYAGKKTLTRTENSETKNTTIATKTQTTTTATV